MGHDDTGVHTEVILSQKNSWVNVSPQTVIMVFQSYDHQSGAWYALRGTDRRK